MNNNICKEILVSEEEINERVKKSIPMKYKKIGRKRNWIQII